MPYAFMPETQPDPHLLMRLLEQQRKQGGSGLVSTQVDPVTGEFVPTGIPPVMGMPIPQQRQPNALDRILGGVLGSQQSYGGLLTDDDMKAARQRALMAMGASLLSGSGPSPVKRGTGELVGNALITGMQAQDQAGQDALQAMLLRTKLQQSGKTNDRLDYEAAKKEGYTGSFEDWKRSSMVQAKDPAQIQMYNLDRAQGYAGSFEQWRRENPTYNPYSVENIAQIPTLINRPRNTRTPLTDLSTVTSNANAVASATAGGQVTGERGAEAVADLPKVESQIDQSLATINQLRGHAGLPYITGWYSKAPIVPSTNQAAADALAQQLEGQNFLTALERMKGTGQITQVEGAQGKAAVARLQRAQDTEDYQAALDDLAKILEGARDKARKAAANAGSGATQPIGSQKRKRYNPQTGKIE